MSAMERGKVLEVRQESGARTGSFGGLRQGCGRVVSSAGDVPEQCCGRRGGRPAAWKGDAAGVEAGPRR